MSIYAYDVETFRNFFSVVFFNLESSADLVNVSKSGIRHPDVEAFVFAPEFGMDDRDELRQFLHDGIDLVGFNNIMFDSPVMDYVLWEARGTEDIFEFAQSLILRHNGGAYVNYAQHNEWNQIDLMKMMAFDALGVSLKQVSINLKWHRVQDLPLPYNADVKEDDLGMVVDYNVNDVLITSKLFQALEKELNLREDLSESYGINLMSASDSRMANLMLEHIYAKESGIPIEDFRFLRTDRELVWLGSCVGKNISFQTETLQTLLTKIRETVVVKENNFSFKEHISFGGVEYDIGVGGLHSVDNSTIFYTTDTHIIRDADVSSYYPNIMLINNIRPKHLDENFSKILGKITKERVEAKHSGDTVKASGLKITINSIFGKLGSDTFWLQDAKALLSVTLSGQLYLLMLIEMLYLEGIKTISANTDGIVCRIPRELEEVYYKTCEEWVRLTGFELEYTDYSKYIRADVNNYITIKPDGKTKTKGRFVPEIGLKKGYRHPIVPRAIYDYFVSGIPIVDTLSNCTDILDFCISQKTGSAFIMEFEDENDVHTLQKNNRFYVSKTGGVIQKRNKQDGRVIGLIVGETVQVLNDYDETLPIEAYEVSYDFYNAECYKYIDAIENGEFDFSLPEEPLGNGVEDFFDGQYPDAEDIEILPPKFRYSSGSYRYNHKEMCIYRGLATINYFTEDSAQPLYDIRDEHFENFLDLLIFIAESDDVKINSRQMEMLIKINFFEEFGANKKLLEFWKEFTSGKFRYSKGHKNNTKAIRVSALMEIWDEIPNKKFSVESQIKFELEILGFIQSKFNVDRNTLLILKMVDEERREKSNWSAIAHVRGLRSGKETDIKISRRLIKNNPLHAGDFVSHKEGEKKQSVRKVEGGFEPIPDRYDYWMYDYEVL